MASDLAPEAPAVELDLYPTTRLQVLGGVVVIQPVWKEEVVGPSLTLDLETGTLSAAEHPSIISDYTPSFGVLGLLNLEGGPALSVISGIEQVALVRGHPLFRVTQTKTFAAPLSSDRWSEEDKRLLRIFQQATEPNSYGGGVYVAYGGDATLTEQRYAQLHGGIGAAAKTAAATGPESVSGSPVHRPAVHGSWARADAAVTWNADVAAPLLDAGLGAFVPPAFAGFAEQLERLRLDAPHRDVSGTLTILARRGRARAGTRQWRRGADTEGNVANVVETEQVFEEAESGVKSSFVQVRGSIPVPWSQAPTLAYKIPITIAPREPARDAFIKHATFLAARYGQTTALSLANLTGREGKLSSAFKIAVDDAKALAKGSGTDGGALNGEKGGVEVAPSPASAEAIRSFRLELFDFHKECGATNYSRLELLWERIRTDTADYGYWFRDSAGTSAEQHGVFRANCIDVLDRTNVVQGALARRALERVLTRLGLLPAGASLAQAFPEVERRFRVAWADHGDALSRQYAGTGAMKSAFTRTGKRDLAGLLDDGAKSLTRYVLNNFFDGGKQDAYDLITGAAVTRVGDGPAADGPAAAAASAAATARSSGRRQRRRASLLPPLLLILIAIWAALSNLRELIAGRGGAAQAAKLVGALIFAYAVFFMIKSNRRRYVDAPTLRPDLVQAWVPAAAALRPGRA